MLTQTHFLLLGTTAMLSHPLRDWCIASLCSRICTFVSPILTTAREGQVRLDLFQMPKTAEGGQLQEGAEGQHS